MHRKNRRLDSHYYVISLIISPVVVCCVCGYWITPAAFMGIPLDEELRAIVLNQSSFSFMKEHQVLFDDHLVRCCPACCFQSTHTILLP